MPLPEQSTLLRIFIGEADEVHGRPLYEAIVARARELHMAGATVRGGPLGFGRSSMLHTEKILRLSQDLPVVIEIVDAEEKIGVFRRKAAWSRPRRCGLCATATATDIFDGTVTAPNIDDCRSA